LPRSLARGDFALTFTLVGVVSVVPEAYEQSTVFPCRHRLSHPLCCKRTLREIEGRAFGVVPPQYLRLLCCLATQQRQGRQSKQQGEA
ncbi:unnamed protein product, partial [Ectocarpus sp. 12 AP-2014]